MSRRKKRHKKSRKRLAYGVIAVIFILLCFAIYSFLHQPNQIDETNDNQFSYKAAIVDHLSFRNETANQTFVSASKNILEKAGFVVEYYRGEEVDINFYRSLLTHGYSLIVLRVHSAIIGTSTKLGLFTSEPYDPNNIPPAYYDDIKNNRIVQAYFTEGDPIHYFAIAPGFVEKYGSFQNTTIIMMGCDGLTYTDMAEAFIERGAKVCIGWNGLVSTPHTDHATTRLLQHLAQGNTVEEAVEETMNEVGPDQGYNSTLQYYPEAAGSHTIQYILGISSIETVRANTVLVRSIDLIGYS